MRVLLVEDDDLIGSGVEAGLRHAGFTVDWTRDGGSAATALSTTEYELLVLDLGLPKLSGSDLLKSLRARGNDIPILVLTARTTVADRIEGLAAGADDYIGKPFDLAELIERCRALLRRAHGRAVSIIRYRDFTVDPRSMTVMRGNERLPVTSRECALLIELLSHQGIPLSRSRLEDSLYGWHAEVESNAIEVHISNLRKKLGADLIKTIRGLGYLVEKAS
ncbi:DNA-binding response OmpR family regulator [Trinickia symbiotica]|uniref:DNA-binding response regulator n=1 Tax=Trinickia symbiotica TaxID=863227 RepID=A0A2N7X5E7_9BURK|nr:response regulator transcription factor [Trinickia symbiotica]PMS36685.1 DNA-binding response regulator [Trinickia symbiotica]PPK46126.1 DNA-binding response OmpR family regulator [Trinickia symbiotica]